MSTDTTAQLADLALSADTPMRRDAVVACARYCGQRATPVQARLFVDEQLTLLASLDDGLSREIRAGWAWLGEELELAALEAASQPKPVEPTTEAARIAVPKSLLSRAPKLRRPSVRLRSGAPSGA